MIEKILAAAGLAVCVGMLVRMALPARQRGRLDAWAGELAQGVRGWRRRNPRGPRPADPRDAARAADELIRRASQGAKRTTRQRTGADGENENGGQVIRPPQFQKPPKDPLH